MGLFFYNLPQQALRDYFLRIKKRKKKRCVLKAFMFSENLADLFFLLLRHKFSSIAYVKLVNFNAEKRKKKEQKIRKPRCFEYIYVIWKLNLWEVE
jgi:hypothetical protein